MNPHFDAGSAGTFQAAYDALEFAAVRELLAREAQCELGRERALSLTPSANPKTVASWLKLTTEARRFFAEVTSIAVGDIPDPRPTLAHLRIGGTRLEAERLREVMRLMESGAHMRGVLRPHREAYPALAVVAERLPDVHGLQRQLGRIILPTGEINDQASYELRRIRGDIQTQRTRLQRHMENLFRRSELEDVFSDQIVTQRNGRYVVPVRNDNRGRVPGVVHALSSSGVTAFVEPMGAIELNNEMVRLQEMEEAEIARLLFEAAELLRTRYDDLVQLAETLGELDFIAAKVRLANRSDASEPTLSADGTLRLEDARHPLLDAQLRATGGAAVPMSFALSAERRAMVISGANAGGKTVVLKTAGLCALMALAGLHVPARAAEIPLFVQVQADIGDHQSLSANLSTFSSHVSNLKFVAENLETPALVLLDEVGTGTDPDEGAALAVALVEYFRSRGAYVIASTHFNPLKVYADMTPGVVNSSVEFDAKTLRPTYRLLVEQAGNSSGIEIARRLGLPEEILTAATQRLGERDASVARYLAKLKEQTDYQRDSALALEEERELLAKKYADLDREYAEREAARRKVFEEQLDTAREEFFVRLQPTLDRIANQTQRGLVKKEAERAAARATSAIAREVSGAAPPPPLPRPAAIAKSAPAAPEPPREEPIRSAEELKVGDRVVTNLGQTATVESVQGDAVYVRIGAMRMKASAQSLRRAAAPTAPTEGAGERAARRRVQATQYGVFSSDAPGEINLLGCTAAEAIERADKFLDVAALGQLSQVRIVHGIGTGVLMRTIDELLTDHPHVKRFYRAEPRDGGDGATIVELRD
jgi:DNA mismatch repair protein MutS2